MLQEAACRLAERGNRGRDEALRDRGFVAEGGPGSA